MLFIIFLLIATPFIYSLVFKEKKRDDNEFKNELASLKTRSTDSGRKIYNKGYPGNDLNDNNNTGWKSDDRKPVPASLFYFDPNTLPITGWKKLGLTDKTITTIQNYLSKGGKFREPADIKKIWGLHKDLAEQLVPYVKIAQPATNRFPNFPVHEKKEYPKKTFVAVDINNADSSAYVSLPGIGPGYAKRILKFRDKLGGFNKIDQVSETFGLPDSTYQKIKIYLQVSPENIRKININTATLDELQEHPYIRYQLANAIVQFRTQHGNFETIEGIKKIMLVTEDIFIRLEPYLTVQ